MNHATRGITAKKRALWSLQDLDSLQIKQRKRLSLGNRDIALIKIDGIGGLDDVVKVILRHTPDGELGVLPRQVARDVNARRIGGNVKTIGRIERSQLVARESAHRDTDILQPLVTLLGCHNNLFEQTLRSHRATQSRDCGCHG